MFSKCIGAAILVTLGCGKAGTNGGNDGGGPPVNQCATRSAALTNSVCKLIAGRQINDLIRAAGDEDWYLIEMPATTNAKTILHVSAGYSVPGTLVNLSVNLIRESDTFGFLQKVDNHGQGAPRPIDMLARYTDASVRVLVQVKDQSPSGRQNFDARNQFSLVYEVVDDPNPHAPNEVAPIALSDQSGVLVGSDYGYLVTPGDVHRFSVQVAPVSSRRIIYLHVTAPALNPPPPFRLAYTLLAPDGTMVAQDQVANVFLAVDLATARLVLPPQAGLYTLVIQAYQPQDTTDPVDGDLRVRWNVEVRLMNDLDTNEPNDTFETAHPVAFTGIDTSQTITGRLAYIPDRDWYVFHLPTNTNPTLFHYKLTPGSGGGRFDPLTPTPDRQLRAFTVVAGGGSACVSDQAACPKGYGTNTQLRALVEGFCLGPSRALCLQTSRDEGFRFPNLGNFEGMLTVSPQSGVDYYVVVQSAESVFADDRDYSLRVEWLSDPDETARYQGQPTKQVTVVPFANDIAGATFPVPPNPGSNVLTGVLSYGHGTLLYHDPNLGQGVRASRDYDSTISDTNVYQFNFPGGLLAPHDRSWELQWSVDGGEYELTLGLQFCDGDVLDGGVCTPVTRSSQGNPLSLAYAPGSFASWHNPSGPYQPIYDRDGGTLTTVRAYGCFCFEPRFVRGGNFLISVSAADRNAYNKQPYTLTTAFTSYPRPFGTLPDGGPAICPAPTLDGGTDGGPTPGCRFTNQ